jgi:hypothetical protein
MNTPVARGGARSLALSINRADEQMQMEENKIKPRAFLPAINTPACHILLGGAASFVLGPLGAVSAA